MPAEPLSSYVAAPAAVARSAPRAKVPLTWSRFRYPQSLYKYGAVLATLAFIAYALDYLNIAVERLPGVFGRVWDTLSTRYYPPNVGHVLQPDYLRSVVETLQMSYLATVVGLAIAVPLAWFASFNMTPSRRFAYPLGRLVIMGARSGPGMIWTILLVAILGFGMLPGAIALTLYCIGFAGKLFSEAVEAIEPGQVG